MSPSSFKPLVSVVLPSFNSVATIDAAIQSILSQTLSDLELIVVDDASTDVSAERAKRYEGNRMRLVQLEQNVGYPTAINYGLDHARGRFLARMDADDVCHPQRLERQIAALLASDAAFCGTTRQKMTPNGRLIPFAAVEDEVVRESWDDLMRGKRRFADPSVVVERTRVDEVGRYRTYSRSGQDVDLWLRLMEEFGECITLMQPLYFRRLRPDAITFSTDTIARNEIPRKLARQRQEGGSESPTSTTSSAQALHGDQSRSSDWAVAASWNATADCLSVRDLRGACSFLFHSLRLSTLSISSARSLYLGTRRCLRALIGTGDRRITASAVDRGLSGGRGSSEQVVASRFPAPRAPSASKSGGK